MDANRCGVSEMVVFIVIALTQKPVSVIFRWPLVAVNVLGPIESDGQTSDTLKRKRHHDHKQGSQPYTWN